MRDGLKIGISVVVAAVVDIALLVTSLHILRVHRAYENGLASPPSSGWWDTFGALAICGLLTTGTAAIIVIRAILDRWSGSAWQHDRQKSRAGR